MAREKHEAVKVDGQWVCQAKHCPHRVEGGGCKLGKVGLRCDNTQCSWNITIKPGVHRCRCMEVYLDENGKCTRQSFKVSV